MEFNHLQAGADPALAENWRASNQDGGSPGRLTEPSEGGYAVWASSYFSEAELADEAVSGPNADPDQDGQVNLLEFAFAGDPKEAGGVSIQVALEEEDAATFVLLLSFNRRVANGLDYVLESSSNLSDWSTVGFEAVGQPVVDGDSEFVVIRVVRPIERLREYFRFQISE